mgnify:CR=1 FL=1
MGIFLVETLKGKNIPTNKDYLMKWGGVNIDIGCGPSKVDGFIGVDIREFPSIDVIHDLDVIPWPFDNSSVDLVIASHVVEHVDSVILFMSELHRILRDDRKLIISFHPETVTI